MGVAIFTLQWLCFTFAPLNGSLKPTMNGAIFFFPATMGVGGDPSPQGEHRDYCSIIAASNDRM